MDQLTTDQQENLRKSSTDRLRIMAARMEEVSDEDVMAMDRPELLQVVAHGILASKESDKAATPKLESQRSDRLREIELQLELKRIEVAAENKRIEAEQELEYRRLEMENKRLEIEQAHKRREMEMELERKKLEVEMKRIEHEAMMAEMVGNHGEGQEVQEGNDHETLVRVGHARPRVETMADRIKRYGSAMKQVISPMTNDASDLPQFFENIEAIFLSFEVPYDLRAKLLLPHLSQKARTLTARLTAEEMDNYEGVKDFLLSEFKLTPREYKHRFDNATKRPDETFVFFTARLRNNLRYYLRSREVGNDIEKLKDLLIADKLKSVLPIGALNYVLSLEGADWFDPKHVADLADTFVSNRPLNYQHNTQHSQRFVGSAYVQNRSPKRYNVGPRSPKTGRRPYNQAGIRPREGQTQPRRCYVCNKIGHIAKFCPEAKNKQTASTDATVSQVQVRSDALEVAQVNLCTGSTIDTCITSLPYRPIVKTGLCLTHPSTEVDTEVKSDENTHSDWEFSDFPTVENNFTTATRVNRLKLAQLQYIDISVQNVSTRALLDSGAQVTVISRSLYDKIKPDICGYVNLQGVIGESTRVPLVNVVMKAREGPDFVNLADGVQVTCAVAPMSSVTHDVILPVDVVKDIQRLPTINVLSCMTDVNVSGLKVIECNEGHVNDIGDEDDHIDNEGDDDDSKGHESNVTSDGQTEIYNVDRLLDNTEMTDQVELIKEQHDDPTLSNCWDMAKVGKGGFVVEQGLLFHNDKVEGQKVCQLCVPECRRASVMRLAHDSVFSGHLGQRKTRERIRLSFYWPAMRQSVQQYVNSCHNCQLRSRPTKLDRVPITPITRVEVPFQVLNMDCIGPIDPPSAQGHRYCLTIVDNCSRWPAVYALKSLTARAVCDALLDLFANVGIPSKIVSDNGSNFNSQLTRELLTRLGCSPVFATPGHPQTSGLVERFNKTCKEMLHHVIQQHKRQWHKIIPLTAWALREIPNATTGISPYALVYGRLPRGPLAVLKESWIGQRDVMPILAKPVEQYMTDLQHRLRQAADWARLHAEHGQAVYAHNHNLRSRDKHFIEGDTVIVLDDEHSGKLSRRWHGPATVVRVKSPYSYLIDMGDGRVKHIHANKMRKYTARVQGCNVISEHDDEFGRVLVPVTESTVDLPSNRVDRDKLSHLDDDQHKQLLNLLDEFADCFDDKPGLCEITEHKIQVTTDFQPKRMRPYRIPEILKPEVEKQIKELLDAGLIVKSHSPMASPLVCVAKKQGGVRLACDYRYVNSYTVADQYPLCTVDEVIRKVGQGRFISVFDAKSGYWQLKVNPECRWLTAFVTHEGLYEWVRMPFGLRNAGATFVRAVTDILRPLQRFSGAYVDDMAVGSESWLRHIGDLRQFLTTVHNAGLTLNLCKCEFAKAEVHLLGHIVGSGSKRADPQRLNAIATMSRPTTKKELRRMLGALGYYREYIPHFAQIARPLSDLTTKRTPNVIEWNEECEHAFVELQGKLCSPPVLVLPYVGKPFELHTDASGGAVAATLGQRNDQGQEHPIAFASQKLSGSQLNWAIIEKEAYAIIWALNRFRDVVFGSHISVHCDHNPLQYIRECAPKSAKLLRWALALQEFDIDVKYTKGSQNVVADFLSRV